MTDDDREGSYVHRPEGPGTTSERDFDWRGWLLVGALIVSFLVVPVAILVLPSAQEFIEGLGLTLRDAYLVLPLVPAFLLGAIAVWSAVRMRAD